MRRKIVLHGPSTLTISLPSSWVKKQGLVKGHELLVEEKGEELHIKTDRMPAPHTKEISIEGLKRVGKSAIAASYRQGLDEVALNYTDASYLQTIHEILSKELIGFEVIRQNVQGCTIKDITGHATNELDNVLRKIWILLVDLSTEAHRVLEKGVSAQSMGTMDRTINKFSNYCLRIIGKKYDASGKTMLLYYLVRMLERLGDQYKDMCETHTARNQKITKPLLLLLGKANQQLVSLSTAFYKSELPELEQLFSENKKLAVALSSLNQPAAVYVSSICRDMRDILSIIVEMKL